MRFPFKVAVRFLKSNKGQTALIALGIAVGVSVQIFIGSLIQGLQKSLVNKTIGNSPQITVTSTNDNKVIEYYNDVLSTVKASDDRIINLSLSIDKPALIKKEDKTYSVLVRGMNLQDSDKIYNIKKRIYEGKEPLNDFETLVGKELKDELNASLGDEIKVITNSGDTKTLKISGFYDLKVANLNKTWLITTLKTSETLYALSGKVTSIEMQVTELFKADDIALNVSDRLDGNLKVDNWKAQNAELLSGLNGQSVSSIMIQVFVLVAVVLGIASVLAITVVQKSKQIGILKAMGIRDKAASLIFLFQGLLLGLMGAILGVALGLFLSFMFTKFALNPDGSPVVELYIDYGFIAVSALIALVSSTLASLIPAVKSSKLNPIDVIKNG
ncbi:lipoprotein-releasing system permease protein [Clostridium punense]|uniref:Lipoprotein-releasing system permease protein n=1 Tax=Clostridium punense TaxID=1054297 RepID=A0ABS4KAZ2_9CLOT|nr:MULTISPECIES: FtsX-like permease family protein [Clostridium]EQB88556.1 permease [Clostridium sp. BL8]MBP2023779.1 lipoprotein-releasing system permease protein [Clostridium punense]